MLVPLAEPAPSVLPIVAILAAGNNYHPVLSEPRISYMPSQTVQLNISESEDGCLSHILKPNTVKRKSEGKIH